MPITKSAKKALRQNTKRKKENTSRKKNVKKFQKEIEDLASKNKKKEAEKLIPQFYKTVDKATKNKILKKNTASRRKSRIAKLVATKKNNKKKK